MKKLCFVCFVLLIYGLVACSNNGRKVANRKSPSPPEPFIPAGLEASARNEFKKQYVQGYELYLMHCAKCHGPSHSKSTPDVFTDTQLLNYNLRNSDTHMAVFQRATITDGELSLVMTYLRYRTSN